MAAGCAGQFKVARPVPQNELLAAQIGVRSEDATHFESDPAQMQKHVHLSLCGNRSYWKVVEYSRDRVKFACGISVDDLAAPILLLIHGKRAHARKFVCQDLQAKDRGGGFLFRFLITRRPLSPRIVCGNYECACNCSYGPECLCP
ncbi:hypothetical protein AN416_02560 [Paraburkholderia caribensis]|nr:hypothetical protein AN416_02560 [Paraburkholderia caribensis]AUT53192.1 hypothetical protein C2L66_15920 [Paraburkholderia caribensis]